MNNSTNLDIGSVEQIFNKNTGIQPILQILDIKRIQTSNAGERFRLVLSDSKQFIQGMLATQSSWMVKQDKIKKFAIIRLKDFVTNTINSKRICVVIKCDPISFPNQKIGDPKAIKLVNNNNNNNNNLNNLNNNNNNNNNMYGNNNNNNNNNGGNFSRNLGQPNNNFQNRNNFGNNNRNDNNVYRPISSLNPYQNGWKIKARCTGKDTIRHYSNQRGSGKVFSVDLLDKEGGEIRATMFNDAVDKFFNIFQKDKIYSISKGMIKIARKGYTHIKNDYSITLNNDSEVIQLQNDDNIKNTNYKFINIIDLTKIEPSEFVDIIGIVSNVNESRNIISQKTQKELIARNISITDKTGCIEMTLWADEATNFTQDNIGSVIAVKGARVSDYGGRSLNPGTIEISPSVPKSNELKQWYNNNGKNIDNKVNKLTERGGTAKRYSFNEVIEQKLGNSNEINPKTNKVRSDYFNVLGTINAIAYSAEKKPWYLSVNPEEEKNSQFHLYKVTPDGDGSYVCDKNGKKYNSFVPRYILRFCASDYSGNLWLTAFGDTAQTILNGVSATAAKSYIDEGDNDGYVKVFKDALFKRFIFRCSARAEKYEDRTQIKYTVHSVQLVDVVTETENLIEKIKQLRIINNGN